MSNSLWAHTLCFLSILFIPLPILAVAFINKVHQSVSDRQRKREKEGTKSAPTLKERKGKENEPHTVTKSSSFWDKDVEWDSKSESERDLMRHNQRRAMAMAIQAELRPVRGRADAAALHKRETIGHYWATCKLAKWKQNRQKTLNRGRDH